MLLRFTFDFVFGELKLCGLHNDRCRLQALDRPKDHLFQVPECADLTTQNPTTLNSQLSTLNSQLRLQLPKRLQEVFVFDPVGVIRRKCAASACHELKCQAARLDVPTLTLPKQRILVKNPQRIGMSRT